MNHPALRPAMHFSAQKITAATLAALLAVLACIEHGLHNISHLHSGLGCCQSGKLETRPTGHCCSLGSHTPSATEASTEGMPPARHDLDNCAVCRFLALPQLFELPPQLSLSHMLVSDLPVVAQASVAECSIRQATIRGPPACELMSSC